MEEYSQIKNKHNLEQNGFIVRIKNNHLEVIAGDEPRISRICSINEKGVLVLNKGYSSFDISKKEALQFREDYLSWKTMQYSVHN